MDKNRFKASGSSVWAKWPTAIAVSLAIGCTAPALAQAPAAPGGAAAAPAAQTSEQLVGRIALYPDDLVAIILPAATNPLQLVQADRFLEKRKTDPKAAMDAKWDDAVKSLLNYPDVVKMMSGDLDWTSALGEAVVADQGAVLEAVQAFRRKAVAAGNLKSDAKQTIVVEKEVIKIVPADPQVVYVPQYNPATVVVVSSTPVYAYYPTPYPAYAYPYAPGAAMAAGVIWGAAIGAAWSGNHYGYGGGNTINVNHNTNINTGNINTGNVNRGGASAQPTGTSSQWKSGKQPGQVSSSVGASNPSARAGDARSGGGAAAGADAARPTSQGSGSGGGAGAAGGGAFGGYGSGQQAQMDSSRGASSRSASPSASSSAGARSAPSGGARSAPSGGGARSGGGGGGRRR